MLEQIKETKIKGKQVTIAKNIKINKVHDFNNNTFKVKNDKELFKLMKSIEIEGVLVPLLARPNKLLSYCGIIWYCFIK